MSIFDELAAHAALQRELPAPQIGQRMRRLQLDRPVIVGHRRGPVAEPGRSRGAACGA